MQHRLEKGGWSVCRFVGGYVPGRISRISARSVAQFGGRLREHQGQRSGPEESHTRLVRLQGGLITRFNFFFHQSISVFEGILCLFVHKKRFVQKLRLSQIVQKFLQP